MCFPRGLLEWVTEAKNVSSSYIFDLWLHVTAKRGNRSEEIPGRSHNNSLCQRNVSWVLYAKFQTKKHFAFPKNVWYQYNTKFCVLSNFNSVFYRAVDWPTTNFLGMYCIVIVVTL